MLQTEDPWLLMQRRERANRAYGFLPYFMSKFMVELPIKVIPAFIYSHVVYWIAGLNPDRFGEMVGLLVMPIQKDLLQVMIR